MAPKKKPATKTRLDPSCWKGYKKSGTKVKGGVRVNNCVKAKKKQNTCGGWVGILLLNEQ